MRDTSIEVCHVTSRLHVSRWWDKRDIFGICPALSRMSRLRAAETAAFTRGASKLSPGSFLRLAELLAPHFSQSPRDLLAVGSQDEPAAIGSECAADGRNQHAVFEPSQRA
jgi:hypothetical protein